MNSRNPEQFVGAALVAGVALAALLEPWLLAPLAIVVLAAAPFVISDARATLRDESDERVDPHMTPLDLYTQS
jgi:hypothetical protein